MGPVTCSCILLLYFYLSVLTKYMTVAIPINYKSCGPNGSIKSMDLSPCTVQPCTFHHGINATVKLDFITNSTSASLKTQVFGIIAGVPIPFPLPNPDACTGCDVTCPIKPGTVYDYVNVLPVRKEYPSLRVVVKWQLVGDNNTVIACVLFPIAIENSADTKSLPIINNNSTLYRQPLITNQSNNPSNIN